jgi:formylglycine-generating enzyme required for sulfatase activity
VRHILYGLVALVALGVGVLCYRRLPSMMLGLGRRYYNGEGVAKNYTKAAGWFRKAALLGDATAQATMGSMYLDGEGVPKDDAEAVKWFRKAADQGLARAQFVLGACYAEGRGVPKDYVEAYAWVNLAAARDDSARSERDLLEKQLPPDQMAAGQRRSAEVKKAIGAHAADWRGPPLPRLDVPRGPAVDQAWSVPDLGMELVWVAPGSFERDTLFPGTIQMPGHTVWISRGYWIGKYEVTQAEYEAVAGANPSNFKGARLPVEAVSWEDAVAFCTKLTQRERAAGRLPAGYEYRLPTEAEWEYAARGGAVTNPTLYARLSNSDETWRRDNSGGMTHPVGQKLPNELGLHDMMGNVWEWCQDWFDGSYYDRSPNIDPANAQATGYRAAHGSSWSMGDMGLAIGISNSRIELAARQGLEPKARYTDVGFRACLAPDIAAE